MFSELEMVDRYRANDSAHDRRFAIDAAMFAILIGGEGKRVCRLVQRDTEPQ